MTTPPVPSITDELLAEIEAAAIDVKGWTMREHFQEPEEGFLPEDWEWYVGAIDEEGNRYPLLNVNAHQYDSGDSEKLAKYYALVNRDALLALITRLRAAEQDARRYRLLRDGSGWPAVFASHDAPEPLRGAGLDTAMEHNP